MSLRDILIIAFDAVADEAALAMGEFLANAHNAALAAAVLTPLPEEPLAYEPTVVSGVWSELLKNARAEGAGAREAIGKRFAGSSRPVELHHDEALGRDLGRVAAVHARYADLTILTRPDSSAGGQVRHELIEGVLFYSGRPALIVPPGWRPAPFTDRVAIAWDASREATRALAEARPFLSLAAKAAIVTVDAKPKAFGHGGAPGQNIAAHLARRGLDVEVRNADGMGRSVAQALIEETQSFGGEMLVMGAYVHSRLREMMFGGATRSLLETAPFPILMAH